MIRVCCGWVVQTNANLFCTFANNPVKYVDPDGNEVISKSQYQIELDLEMDDIEYLAVSFQKEYEKGGFLQQIFSSFGAMGNVSAGTQYTLEAIGKSLNKLGEAAFKVVDKACYFIGILQLLIPDNVTEPRNAVFSFWASLKKAENDSSLSIISIKGIVTFTEEKAIVNHHDDLVSVRNKTHVVLEANIYDKYDGSMNTVTSEYTLESSHMEF